MGALTGAFKPRVGDRFLDPKLHKHGFVLDYNKKFDTYITRIDGSLKDSFYLGVARMSPPEEKSCLSAEVLESRDIRVNPALN